MKLTVVERLSLLNILPQQGDILTLRIVRELTEALSFTEEEHEALGLTQEEGRVVWKSEADIPKEVEIGTKATEIIHDTLMELNQKKKLLPDYIPLWDRFVGGTAD
jgi:hypothetical protein